MCIYDEVGVGNKVGFKVEVLSGGKKDLIFSVSTLSEQLLGAVYDKEQFYLFIRCKSIRLTYCVSLDCQCR